MAKASKAVEDDVLAGKDDVLAGKKKANKKAPPAKKAAAKKTGKKAEAEDEPAPKGKKKAPAAAKRAKAEPAGDIAPTEDVRAALLKCKKLTSYADVQEATGFNIRQIRRTARAMRDNEELTIEKDGTVAYVKRA